MSLFCCLCHVSVDGDHRRRKKLHGRSCDTAKKVIGSISGNALTEMMRDPNAFLCNACEKVLNNIKITEEKLEVMYSSIKKKLAQRNDNEEDIPRKRLRIQGESGEVASQGHIGTISSEVPTSSFERHCSKNTTMESDQGNLSMQPSPPVKVSFCLKYTNYSIVIMVFTGCDTLSTG